MERYNFFWRLIYISVLSNILFSCSNEEHISGNSITGLEINADFLKLIDDGSDIAGELSIISESTAIQLIWNTDSICNLDTSLTSISSQSGKYVLPIKWKKVLPDGNMGPKGVAYKAGVKVIAGDYSQYVPLIWSEKIDTMKIMEMIPATRSANDILPRISQITMFPTTVHMNYENGGIMYVGLSEVPFAILDVSKITPNMNINISLIPECITESQMINFKWNSKGAPSTSFSANVIAMSEGIIQSGVVSYEATHKDYIEVADVKWAPGNLLYNGSEYYFDTNQFTVGDYFGWNWYSKVTNTANFTNIYDYKFDPCSKVLPTGTWKTPTREEWQSLINEGYRKITSPMKAYIFSEEVVLVAGGFKKDDGKLYYSGVAGEYWTSELAQGGMGYVFVYGEQLDRPVSSGGHWSGYGVNVRCVKIY